MKLQIDKGSTSQIVTVFIQDSSVTDGSGLGSLDQTSSIVGGYVRDGATGLALAVDENVTTEGTYEAPTTDNQVRIGTPANMTSGTYELHFHNDLFAAGAGSVFITLAGASNMAVLVIEIQLTDTGAKLDRNADLVESQRGSHTWQGEAVYVGPTNGNDTTGDGSRALPYATVTKAQTVMADSGHGVIFLLADNVGAVTTLTEDVTITKRYISIRGPGRDFIWRPTANNTVALTITADGVETSGFQLDKSAAGTGGQHGIQVTAADLANIHHVWFLDTRGDGINILRGTNCQIHCNNFNGTGVNANGEGIHIRGTAGSSNDNVIHHNHFARTGGDAILIEDGTTDDTEIHHNTIHNAGGWGVNIGASSANAQVHNNIFGNNTTGNINDGGTDTIDQHNIDLTPYMHAAIWVDTVGGTSGADPSRNGQRGRPVDNESDAVSLSSKLGIDEYHLLGASSLTLTVAHENWAFFGQNGATLDLGGQNVSGSHFECLTVTGDADSNDITGRYCKLQSLTNLIGTWEFCFLLDNATLAQGDHFLFQCASGVAGTGTPYIDVDGDDINARNLNVRGWWGGLEVRTHTSTDTTSFDCAAGQIVVAASGTGGTIAMRGNMNITDNASGAVTFSQNAALNRTAIADGVLNRGASNIEDTADRHSLGAMIMIGTNSSIAGLTLTANKPGGGVFDTYTVTVDANADPITGVS